MADKGAGPSVAVSLLLNPDQVALLKGRGESSRACLDRAVAAWLPQIVEGLTCLGFAGDTGVQRRARRLSKETWDELCLAAEQSGLSAPILLRACVQLESQKLKELDHDQG